MQPQHEIVSGVFYVNHPPHRNDAAEKSQWCISEIEERDCFAKALSKRWILDDVGWGLHLVQYTDPFLFFAYEFRRWTLDAELILAIGYGFGDDHINSILGQALENASNPKERKLLAVAPFKEETPQQATARLEKILKVKGRNQVEVQKMGAGEFMRTQATIDNLSGHLPPEDDTFGEL